MELSFKQSNLSNCKIVETSDGQKYIMDTSTLVGKIYYWGMLPSEITVEMTELEANNHQFEIKTKPDVDILLIAALVQPLVKSSDKFLQGFFHFYGVSQQLILKILLFMFSLAISYLISDIFLKKSQKKVSERLSPDLKKYKLTFSTTIIRNYSSYFYVFLNLACLIGYLVTNNETEGWLLVINCILGFFTFISCRAIFPLAFSYQHKHIILKSFDLLDV